MYSQFFQIGEALENIRWELSNVVHAQVTVDTHKEIVKIYIFIYKSNIPAFLSAML